MAPSGLADYVELNAIASDDNSISALDVARQVTKPDDEDEDIIASDDVPDHVAAAFAEVGYRSSLAPPSAYYPFSLDDGGDLIRFHGQRGSWLYLFCLLATRADMLRNRTQTLGVRTLDGTKLLEHVTPFVLKHHLRVSEAIVIGTSRNLQSGGVGLKRAVQTFLRQYKESGAFENRYELGTSGDGGCDVIAWYANSDGRAGKATIFCSCKTGHNWQSSKYEPDPAKWSRMFVQSKAFNVIPLPCIVVTESLEEQDYRRAVESSQLLGFDRLRISSAEATVPAPLRHDCIAWTRLAAKHVFSIPIGRLKGY